jgi:hypothetical protein
VNRTDPFGLFVFGSYDQATGKLYLYDLDTGQGIFAEFYSGGPFGAPVPNGMYDILFHGRKRDFYRLEPVDTPYGDDTDQRTGRSNLRLHKPGPVGSTGCITAKNWDEWNKVRSFIDKTKTYTVDVPSKWMSPKKRMMHPTERLLWFGRIIVIGSE